MKKIIIPVSLMAMLFTNCTEEKTTNDQSAPVEEQGFELKGNLSSLQGGMLYLSKTKDGEFENIDSCKVVDGSFDFKGEVNLPEVFYIKGIGDKELLPVFVENSTININGTNIHPDSAEIEGSSVHLKLDEFELSLSDFDQQLRQISNDYYAAADLEDAVTMEEKEADYEKIDAEKTAEIRNFVGKNNSTVLGPYIVARYMTFGVDAYELDSIVSQFTEDVASSKYVVSLQEKVGKMKKTEIGSEAPLFSQNNADGEAISLDQFKGTYVLLDFWASWCGPCRAENPNVVKEFNKYKDQGFDILGISLDKSKENWLEAIETDLLDWTQVSDLKGWGNEVADQYSVVGIPASFLLDPDGVIIAKNLRGEDLSAKLAEIFN